MNKDKQTITFYGTTWCADCRRAKRYLDDHDVQYDYVNIDESPVAAEKVIEINKGFQSIPTIVFPDGEVLIEPSNDELQKAIEANKKCIVVHKKSIQKGG